MATTMPHCNTPTGWARSYAGHPQKAARALMAARAHAQQARQDGNAEDAGYWEEVGDALDAVLGQQVRCRRCGRALTHPTSVASGIGPECAGKAT